MESGIFLAMKTRVWSGVRYETEERRRDEDQLCAET
jgi:hypothetical protein